MAGDDDEATGPLPPGAEPYSRAQKALLAAVVVVGLLIMIGVGVVIMTIVNRLGTLSDSPETASKATSDLALPAMSRLALPAGAVIEEMTLDGSRLAIRFQGPEGRGILIYDLKAGKALGTIEITP
ncbi:MAG: DUF6476 family protein [Hyphomicrobiaceae bacterium]